MKVEIAKPFATAVSATLGVFAALAILLLVVYITTRPVVDSKQIRANCARHGGVAHIDEGTTFMQGSTFVTCRDGWFERVDN